MQEQEYTYPAEEEEKIFDIDMLTENSKEKYLRKLDIMNEVTRTYYPYYSNLSGKGSKPELEIKLGLWCRRQREQYAQRMLTKYQEQRLKEIGFDFDNTLEGEWERRYAQYEKYINETGSAEIPRRFIFENEKLGAWVDTQRKRLKEGKMSVERIKKMHKLDPERF